MKKITMRLFRAMSLVLLCSTTGVHGATLAEPPYPRTNLLSFLALWKPTPTALGTVCGLQPQWIGTVKRAYLRGGEDIYREDQPNNLRLTHLMVLKDHNDRTNLIILRGRITAQGKLGSYIGGEAPVFMSNLPSVKTVSEAKNVDDLHKIFGPQDGITDSWGSEGRKHWSEGWTRFTAEGDSSLRYLSVFAHVSSSDREKPVDIDILDVREGFFHPANLNSAAELRNFKTGEELETEYEASRAEARAVYPPPLRLLVEAMEAQDDSDLIAYKRALNKIRTNPPPVLFRQFAERIHEGTGRIQGMLGDLLFDSYLDLEKWGEPQRRTALRALVDSLPYVKTNQDLDHLIALLLQAHGGGELKIKVSGSTGVIDVKAQRSDDGSRSTFTTSSQNISSKNLAPAADEAREKLKQMYPELR